MCIFFFPAAPPPSTAFLHTVNSLRAFEGCLLRTYIYIYTSYIYIFCRVVVPLSVEWPVVSSSPLQGRPNSSCVFSGRAACKQPRLHFARVDIHRSVVVLPQRREKKFRRMSFDQSAKPRATTVCETLPAFVRDDTHMYICGRLM